MVTKKLEFIPNNNYSLKSKLSLSIHFLYQENKVASKFSVLFLT